MTGRGWLRLAALGVLVAAALLLAAGSPLTQPAASPLAVVAAARSRLYAPLLQLRRVEVCPAPAPAATAPPAGRAAARAHLTGLRLISYFPAESAWANMWSRWNGATIDADFARLA